MTASWHVVAKLLNVSRMSKVDYRNKVLPEFHIHYNQFTFFSKVVPSLFWNSHATISMQALWNQDPDEPYIDEFNAFLTVGKLPLLHPCAFFSKKLNQQSTTMTM